jgi:hypothetical protein
MTETLTLNPAGFRELDGEELFAVDGGAAINALIGGAHIVAAIGCGALAIMTTPATGGLTAALFWTSVVGNFASGMQLIFG